MSGPTPPPWYVSQHMRMTPTFTRKRGAEPPPEVKMDPFAGDSTFPQPGSGSNSGFMGGATPPGPVFIVVNRTGAADPLDFLIVASTQIDFGAPPGGGPGGGMFEQPSTSLKAGVYACGTPETLVPKGRV